MFLALNDVKTLQAFGGGTVGITKIKYAHISVRIQPIWYFLQTALSLMWDVQYYLQIPWFSDN